MCHLPLTKGEVGASTSRRSSFLSAKSKHQTIHNKHAFKQSFKKYDIHGMQHKSGHNICMTCNSKGAWITLIKPFGWSKVRQSNITNFILNL